MDWQQTIFFTIVFLVIAFLLVQYVMRNRKQEVELNEARKRPDSDEEIRVLTHELKNALTLTDTMRETIENKGFNEKRFRLLVDGLTRFGEVVRIADGRVGGKRVELAEMVEKSLSILSAFPDVEVNFEPCDGAVIGTELLNSALVNLFKNAAEAMENSPEKRLYVNMESKNNRILLLVKDTGCGIAPEMREKIWEKGVTTKKTGSGIGMDVIKRGIESADGRLLLLNSEPGEGAEFIFAFRVRAGE